MTWLTLNWQWALQLLGEHLALAVPAIVLSALIAIPLGRFAVRRPRIGTPLLGTAALLYAIPALPLLIVIPVLFGLPLRSTATMTIALTVYGVALFVRTSVDAFASVDASVRDAATAIGYSRRAAFWQVELPLAVPVLVAGLRVVAVSTVGLVTIGALVGVQNLGTLMTDGFQRGLAGEVAVGVIATVLLALVIDGVLLLIGRALTPWTRRVPAMKAVRT
jgi:osmoprotectant transport system permease protein